MELALLADFQGCILERSLKAATMGRYRLSMGGGQTCSWSVVRLTSPLARLAARYLPRRPKALRDCFT